MRKWRIEDSEELYNITGWGTSYFGINDKGHVVVTPRRDGVTVDLKELVDELQLRDVASPMLIRFPDILDNRIEKTAYCFKQASEEYGYKAQNFIIYPIKVNQMRPVVVQSSADFYLAKARTLGMYTNGDNKLGTDLLNAWDKGNIRQQHAAQYGRALLAMESNNFDQARKTLQPLLNADPQNAWYLDLATDIDLGQKKTSDAINRLKNARELRTNPVLQLNLANALLQGGQPGEAATILNRYTFTYKEDGNGWDLLAQAEGALGNRDQELAARAESMALVGQLEQAISLLSSASSQVKLGSLQQARYDARIDQLRDLQARFRPYQKM